jgi:hypothetical protein
MANAYRKPWGTAVGGSIWKINCTVNIALVERIKVQTNVAARDRAIDQLRNSLLYPRRRHRVRVGCAVDNRISDIPCLMAM